jgi:GT2 family glycosyltransferase
MMKNLKQGYLLFRDSLLFFYKGLKENLLKEHLKAFFYSFSSHLGKFHFQLKDMKNQRLQITISSHPSIKGLHTLLPDAKSFNYSILIELINPSTHLLKSCLSSVCLQTASSLEILIGSKVPTSSQIIDVIQEMQKQHPNVIKFFDFTNTYENHIYNLLAREAKGNFLLFLHQEDWIRHDLLYRYEQFLRTQSHLQNVVVNCFENSINENDCFIPGCIIKKKQPQFPYVFQSPFDLRGVLISKTFWDQVGGIRTEFVAAGAVDFFLRADLAGASFTSIPFCLYSRRKKQNQTSLDVPAFILSLMEYAQNKGLNWIFEKGYVPHAVKAIPQILQKHKIQIIIPYKEQKDLTVRCVDSVLKQRSVDLIITAIDNGSSDHSIGKELSRLGCEVIRIDEPFNYSRLNNLAIANTKTAQECDLVLFLNNDVELNEDALLEMVRWIDQPSIGMVGARLHYPNGQLQHGGLHLNAYHLPEQLWWDHKEKYLNFAQLNETMIHAVVDAVTAACALIKKETFLKVGGFDEIWYPISYSDTHLAFKLNAIGLKCFYTPYAFGIHHESLTRKESFDDVEVSRWLHQLTYPTLLGKNSIHL